MASSSFSSYNHGAWSDLPDGLLYSILTLLPSIHDLLAFSSVCRSWRSLASSVISPCPTSFFPPLLLHFLFIPHRRRFVPSDLLLVDPSLPLPVTPLNRSPLEAQSILNLHFLSSSHGHLLFFSNYHRNQVLIVDFITGHQVVSPVCPLDSDLPFCLANLTAPLLSVSSSLVLLTHKSLFVWQVGDAGWIHHSLDIEIQFASEMTVVGSRIYAMDKTNKLFTINMLPELSVTRLRVSWSGNEDRFYVPSHRLVHCDGELLSVCFLADKGQECTRNLKLKVFRLKFSNKKSKWVKIESLGNRALFVNADRRVTGFGCKNPERWGGKSNCVYYSGVTYKGSWSVWSLGKAVGDSEILNWLKSKFYNTDENTRLDQIWAYPNILSEEKSTDQI
ncbi:hypothetical protein LUZ60_001117 [Juncus effusus]|nr:hypothetical protein LUZ60_001117 [Juncus effusus]